MLADLKNSENILNKKSQPEWVGFFCLITGGKNKFNEQAFNLFPIQ